MARHADGTLDLFVRSPTNTVVHRRQVSPGVWGTSTFQSLGGRITGQPIVADNGDRLAGSGNLTAVVYNSSGVVYYTD